MRCKQGKASRYVELLRRKYFFHKIFFQLFKDKSALMAAAKNGSSRAVKWMLEAGANPKLENSEGMTALAYGIENGNVEVIELLAKNPPKTQSGVKMVIVKLAESSIKMNNITQRLLEKILDLDFKENSKALIFYTSIFGNENLLDYLLNKSSFWDNLDTDDLQEAFAYAVQSDKVEPVKIILHAWLKTFLNASDLTEESLKIQKENEYILDKSDLIIEDEMLDWMKKQDPQLDPAKMSSNDFLKILVDAVSENKKTSDILGKGSFRKKMCEMAFFETLL